MSTSVAARQDGAVSGPQARRRYVSHTERLEAVLEITRLLAAEVELDRLLPLSVRKTCDALNADRTTVFLIDTEQGQLYTKVVSQLEISEIRLPLGAGLAGYVATTGETLNIPDCYQDPRFDQSWDRRTGYRTRSMLVMPMRDGSSKVIGVFQVINKLGPNGELLNHEPEPPSFTEDDVEYLESIAASAAIAVQNALLIAETRRMFSSTVETLAATIDAKGQETAGHSQRVAMSAAIMARKMRLSDFDVERIRYAGLLHDFGKVFVPDAVLMKPGKLDDDEFKIMQSHAAHTMNILQKVRFLPGYDDIVQMAGQHHEKLDGSGYPLGVKGDQITLGGRLLAIADTYDALRMRRYYKPAFSIERSLAILKEEAERGKLDPAAIEVLESCIEEIEKVVGPLRPGWEEEQAALAAAAAGNGDAGGPPPKDAS